MQDIKTYEAIAKLDLTENERAQVSQVADLLFESFEVLRDIDVTDVEPLVSVICTQNVLRDDMSAKLISREELLANAPEQYDGYFQVPEALD